jgi:hypothetical protein
MAVGAGLTACRVSHRLRRSGRLGLKGEQYNCLLMTAVYPGAEGRAVEVAAEKHTHFCGAVFLLAHIIFDGFGVIEVIREIKTKSGRRGDLGVLIIVDTCLPPDGLGSTRQRVYNTPDQTP